MTAVSKSNDSIKSSTTYIGYIILKEIQKHNKKISIYSIADALKKNGLNNGRHLTIGLSFLYSLDLIKFEEPYVWID